MLTAAEALELVKQVTLPKGAVARILNGAILVGNQHANIALSGDMLLNEDMFLFRLQQSLPSLGPAMEQMQAEKEKADITDTKLKADLRFKTMNKRRK